MYSKKSILKLTKKLAERAIVKAEDGFCLYWTYQPKKPDGIETFVKDLKTL